MRKMPQSASRGPTTGPTYLDVARIADGRYSVVFNQGSVSRQSYASSLAQVVAQARLAGDIAVRTEDEALRERCREVGLALLDAGEGA